MEPTNPPILRPQAAQPAALRLGSGLAQAVPMVARAGLAPAPTVPRQFQLGQFSPPPSPVPPRRQPAQVRFIRPRRRPEPPMRLAFGTRADLGVVLGLIEDARRWLKARAKTNGPNRGRTRNSAARGSSWDWSTRRR